PRLARDGEARRGAGGAVRYRDPGARGERDVLQHGHRHRRARARQGESLTTSAALGHQPSVGAFSGAPTEWDDFVRAQTGWTHFHLYGGRSLVEELFGHEGIYLAARDARGALVGVLPLVRVRSAIFGHYLVSMPFVNYGGPLGAPEAQRALLTHAAEVAAS